MPAKEVSMRKIKQLLRLHLESKLSQHQIAQSLGLSSGVVNKYIKRAQAAGLTWPLPRHLEEDEQALRIVLRPTATCPVVCRSADIDFALIHQELKRKHMTLQLLWEEYCQGHSTPVSYSHFCLQYRQWKKRQPQSMRQTHLAGDKVFVDYAGHTIDLLDPDTGVIRCAQVFIGVLGCSNYTFAEATWTQQLPDWIGSHQRMFAYFGGVPALIVPDNLRSGVSKADRYDPDLNPTYAQMAEHYQTAIMPARPYKPKDKAKAEVGVQIVSRWILMRLRHRTFVGLAELNTAIRELLLDLNQRAFKRLPGCRQSQFEQVDKPALRPLPTTIYEYRAYKKARVSIDYHVELEGHYYSVPYHYCGEQVEVWYGQYDLRCYLRGQCIATHLRSQRQGAHTTVTAHMPKAHQKHLEWTPGRLMNWAKDIGPATLNMVTHLLENRPHPEQGYRSCLGLLNLTKRHGRDRLEKACQMAWDKGLRARRSVESILSHKLDQQQSLLTSTEHSTVPTEHENVRGAQYYH